MVRYTAIAMSAAFINSWGGEGLAKYFTLFNANSVPYSWQMIRGSKLENANPHFYQDFVARQCRGAWIQGASGSFSASATEGPAGVLDSTSRSQKERNAVDTVLPQQKSCEKCGLTGRRPKGILECGSLLPP